MTPRLLVVDDDRAALSLVAHQATQQGFDVLTATTATDACRALEEHRVDLVMLDAGVPGLQGSDAFQTVRSRRADARVVLMTGQGTIEHAVEAVRRGAFDYLTKPLEPTRLATLFQSVREEFGRRHAGASMLCGMVGRSEPMQSVFSVLRRFAPHAHTALVTGETGTGKELAARALHQLGPRAQRRFLTVNCSAVVETLFESELFGHVRGAFTGATEPKAGLFEAADGGTMFLDEVGELPASAQAKLLRVLEGGEVLRVGALDARRVDVHVIAATNRDLQAEVEAGRFRRDLYYRLNVVEIALPPLRDRRDDIPLLAAAFVARFAQTLGKPLSGLTRDAELVLAGDRWDGNVRELRNVIERACILAEGEQVGAHDVDVALCAARGTRRATAVVVLIERRPVAALADVAREHIVRTLDEVHGNKAVAARKLGISRRAFYRQLERHGLYARASSAALLGRAS